MMAARCVRRKQSRVSQADVVRAAVRIMHRARDGLRDRPLIPHAPRARLTPEVHFDSAARRYDRWLAEREVEGEPGEHSFGDGMRLG